MRSIAVGTVGFFGARLQRDQSLKYVQSRLEIPNKTEVHDQHKTVAP